MKVFTEGQNPNKKGLKFNKIEYEPRISQFHKEIVEINTQFKKENKFERWNKIYNHIIAKLEELNSQEFFWKYIADEVKKLGINQGENRDRYIENAKRLFYLLNLTALWSLHRRLQFSISCISKQIDDFGVKDGISITEFKDKNSAKNHCRELLIKVEESINLYQKKYRSKSDNN